VPATKWRSYLPHHAVPVELGKMPCAEAATGATVEGLAYNRGESTSKGVRNMGTEQFVVDPKGKKTGVILPLREYQKLQEDLHDLAVVAERRSEKPISAEAMKRRLKKDGLL
jgi:hypothetical protein